MAVIVARAPRPLLLSTTDGEAAPVVVSLLEEEATPDPPAVEIVDGRLPSANEAPHCYEAAFLMVSSEPAETLAAMAIASVVMASPQSVQ